MPAILPQRLYIPLLCKQGLELRPHWIGAKAPIRTLAVGWRLLILNSLIMASQILKDIQQRGPR